MPNSHIKSFIDRPREVAFITISERRRKCCCLRKDYSFSVLLLFEPTTFTWILRRENLKPQLVVEMHSKSAAKLVGWIQFVINIQDSTFVRAPTQNLLLFEPTPNSNPNNLDALSALSTYSLVVVLLDELNSIYRAQTNQLRGSFKFMALHVSASSLCVANFTSLSRRLS